MKKIIVEELKSLTTAHLADGCLGTNSPVRVAPTGLRPLTPDMRCSGRAHPVRHVGSIDVFFECLQNVTPGEILVIDNGGRFDEACVGDIVAIEAKNAGIAGIVIWGLHRDSKELGDLAFPLFSLGAIPTGPQRLHPRPKDIVERATVGMQIVTPQDYVVADANGVIFLAEERLEAIVNAAAAYRETEARQLKAMAAGRSYRVQTRFKDYLSRRDREADYGFRQHLKEIEAAGEA